jgi:cytochrome c-type biogenesis protein CcmH
MIGIPEAQAAQVEVSRRLIAAAQTSNTTKISDDGSGNRWRRRVTAIAALVLMPVSAGAIYLALGSPDLPGQALSDRMKAAEQNSLPAMIARVETHLEQNPPDGRGWEVVAPVYMRSGRYDDAVRAERNAIKLLGETSTRLGDLGEALISQANGVITAEAKSLFEKVAAQDAGDARAQFYVGLAAEQDGRSVDAATIWHMLIAKAPADAPWLEAVREALARVEGGESKTAQKSQEAKEQETKEAGVAAPGPSAEDIASAAQMPPADRDRMVRTMVERLETRLHEDGNDVDGWLRLMRARMVLGERDKATAAMTEARRALKDAPDKLRQIDDGAKSFGLGG